MSNNVKKIKIIKTLALKQKVKHHFMKRGDNISEGNKHYNDFLFSFSTRKLQSFVVSKMNVEKIIMEKLQRKFREKLQKLKEEQESDAPPSFLIDSKASLK